jgi:TPR repeat protein
MFRNFQSKKTVLLSLLALCTLVVAGWAWHLHTRLPNVSQIEQWGVLAGVQDEEAIDSLRNAANSGSIAAARVLGQVLVSSADEALVQKGQVWLQRAAEGGDARASLVLGKLLLKGGPGVEVQSLAAIPWLEAAVNGGQTGAAHYLGVIYRQDLTGQPRSPEKALHWLEIAAKAGVPDSQFLLGQMLMTGDGIEPSPALARFWFEAAAEKDHPEANLQLLMAYTRNELGLKRDAEAESRQWKEAQHSLSHRPSPP